MMAKLKIGLVGATQANFQGNKEQLFAQSIAGLTTLSEKLGFDFYSYPEFVVTAADAARAKQAMEAAGVDFLLVQNSTFAAGEIIITLARTKAFIGLWALPETSYRGSHFVESLNSFCGANMYGSIIANYLKEYAIKYKWFYGYTDHPMFQERFEVTVKALTALKKMRNSRVALIGGIAPGFNDLYFDERLGQKRLGVEIQRNHEFSEIKDRALSYREADIAAELETVTCGYRCIQDAAKENIEINARFYKAYVEFCREFQYDALGISCWPKMKAEMNGLSCSIIAKLCQNGIPAACEGDLPGAVSMLLLKYIVEQPVTLMDLASLDEADQTVLLWHCGPTPEHFANCEGATLTYSYQPASKTVIDKIGLVNDLVLQAQPVTVMRITGEWDKMFLADGKASDQPKDSPGGSRGWVGDLKLNRRPISVRDFVNTILVQGFQHHYPMASGDVTEVLMEIANLLDISLVDAVEYQKYYQNPR